MTLIAGAQRVALQLPPRRAAQDDFKKATISRAEGGQLQAPVGRQRAGIEGVFFLSQGYSFAVGAVGGRFIAFTISSTLICPKSCSRSSV